jgi:hypothetical protein
LDRFLLQSTFLSVKKIISTKILPKLTSDHKPILLLFEEEEKLGPIPFRFSPLWTDREGFMDIVSKSWSIPVNGSPNYVWEQKLKATKTTLKEWIKKPPDSPTSLRKQTTNQLLDLQLDLEQKDITYSEIQNEQEAQLITLRSFRVEEESLRLKSRNLWLESGDKNSAFFHKQIRARLSRNHIAEITSPDGTVHKGIAQLKEVATSHFQQLYKEEGVDTEEEFSDFLTHVPRMVNEEDNSSLLKPFTEDEISNVIWMMEPDKAPGPDGFSIHFYRTCWDIIKADLFRMIKSFLQKGKVGGSTNSTFLALIPKEANPVTFDHFRPISLCNASYKILSKLLANRIKPLLEKLISPSQGGFVKGRHILDNVILVQETIHSSHQRQEQGMIIKLDMANPLIG